MLFNCNKAWVTAIIIVTKRGDQPDKPRAKNHWQQVQELQLLQFKIESGLSTSILSIFSLIDITPSSSKSRYSFLQNEGFQ